MVILRESLYCNLGLVITRTFCELGNIRYSARTVLLVRSRNIGGEEFVERVLRLVGASSEWEVVWIAV